MKTFEQYKSSQNLITKKLGNVSIYESKDYISERSELHTEGIRNKMTPKSKEDITKSLSKLNSYELANYISDYILKKDKDMMLLILTHCDLSKLSDMDIEDIIAVAIDVNNMTVIHYFLDKGLSQMMLINLYDYAQEQKKDKVSELINKYISINEGIRDMMTPISDNGIKKIMIGLPFDEILELCEINGVKITDYFSVDEIKEMLNDLPDDKVLNLIYSSGMLNITDYSITDYFSLDEIKKKLDSVSMSPSTKLKIGCFNNFPWLVKQALEEGANPGERILEYQITYKNWLAYVNRMGYVEISKLLMRM